MVRESVNQSGRRRNGLRRKGFVEEPSLKFRMKGGRKDESGDSEDGEDRVPTVLVKKIFRNFPGLSRTPETFFQDPVVCQ